MTRLEIDALYDEMSALLTEYEIGYDTTRMEYDLYKMLVKIQNVWELIVKED